MIESAYTIAEYTKMYPILRNPRFLAVFEFARESAMSRALHGEGCRNVPLYSHDATYQSVFTRGWRSVSAQDVRLQRALNEVKK